MSLTELLHRLILLSAAIVLRALNYGFNVLEQQQQTKDMKKLLLLLLVTVLLISCDTKDRREPLVIYRGGIIYDREFLTNEKIMYDIYLPNKKIVKRVQAFKKDYNAYKVGDTIK